MQTFLPYPDFYKTAQILDTKRLGKQRVEALQILKGNWPNHPASKMWLNHHGALACYGIAICDEWINRSYMDSCRQQIEFFLGDDTPPYWLGDKNFHLGYQSNLVRKLPEHYRQFFPDVPDNLPYIWPKPNLV
jgi:hypothetical protein